MTDHYFSPTPNAPERRRHTDVTLRGRDYSVAVASGTFSPGALDRGTAVLLAKAAEPEEKVHTAVDLGCGWGPITLALAASCPGATVWAVDVNQRARELTAENAQKAGFTNVRVIDPDGFPEGHTVDLIWSNPPIRIGKEALHELLTTWLKRLSETGEAWLVVGKHLGAESLLTWLNDAHEGLYQAARAARDKGFHVIKVTRRS
jgi:16S rRNA (guanine1207-N2)-methyltransferase